MRWATMTEEDNGLPWVQHSTPKLDGTGYTFMTISSKVITDNMLLKR